jgi:hypothetical protein
LASRYGNEAARDTGIIFILSGAPAPTIIEPTGAYFMFLNAAKLFASPGLKKVMNDASVREAA